MNKEQQQVKARKDWLKIYLESGVCNKYGFTLWNCKVNTLPLDKKI